MAIFGDNGGYEMRFENFVCPFEHRVKRVGDVGTVVPIRCQGDLKDEFVQGTQSRTEETRHDTKDSRS